MIDFYIILVETETSGNAGSVSRLMGNFGFSNLVLINPVWKSELQAYQLAHTPEALKIYEKKRIFRTLKQAINELKLNNTIGFTRRIGKDREISINYRTYFENLFKDFRFINYVENKDNNNKVIKTGLIFGRESSGLTSEEVELCNILCYIPTSNTSPSLNLSHAIGIVLNEIFYLDNFMKKEFVKQKQKDENKKVRNTISYVSGMVWDVESLFKPSTIEEKEIFYKEIEEVSKRKKLFVRNDISTFKRLFERIFNLPYITSKDLKLLKSTLMRFIYADVIEERKSN